MGAWRWYRLTNKNEKDVTVTESTIYSPIISFLCVQDGEWHIKHSHPLCVLGTNPMNDSSKGEMAFPQRRAVIMSIEKNILRGFLVLLRHSCTFLFPKPNSNFHVQRYNGRVILTRNEINTKWWMYFISGLGRLIHRLMVFKIPPMLNWWCIYAWDSQTNGWFKSVSTRQHHEITDLFLKPRQVVSGVGYSRMTQF